MSFYAPENFLFLWSIPVAIALFWISKQIWKRRLSKIGSLLILKNKLMPSYRPAENAVRLILIILILALSVSALARPQWGEEKRKIQRKGVDVIFLLDTSLSMLAEDIKPSRFEKSKIEIRNILQKLKGDRVGMVAFAGSSFLQSPLTLDYSAFMLFLEAIKVGYIPDPGTSLDRALRLALHSFPEKDNKYKTIILFTDGEDNEGGIDSALEEVKKSGLRVYTIGVGTPQGEPIPLRDENHRKSGFKKDRNGQVVITKLNQELLEKIAKETGGIYLPSTPGEEEIEILLKHMESIGKREYKEKLITEREDHFQIFLFFAILFLLAETLVQRTRKISKKIIAVVAFLGLFTSLQSSRAFADDPVKLYADKKYKSAMDVYQKAKIKNPDDPTVRYNLGTTLYQMNQFHDAAQELETTSKTIQDPATKAKALYNYGNAQYRLGNFDKAIESYQKALEINPDDKDSKYNLEFIQNQKKLFDKKDSERKNDQSKKQNPKNQQQNQQNQQQNQQNNQQNQQNQQNQNNQQNNQQNQQNQQQNNQQQQNQQQQNQNQSQQNSQNQKNQPQQDQQQKQDQQDQQDQQQKQDQKDQQDQQQKQDQKDQQDQQQKQDQKDQQDQQQKQDQKNQQDQQQKQDQKDQQDQQDQKKDQQQKPEDKQGDQDQQKDKEPEPRDQKSDQQPQEPKDQDQTPQQAKQDEEQNQQQNQQDQPQNETPQQQPQEGQRQQGQNKRPLQGQMSMENAMQILEALKEGEKDMQDLRRPTNQGGESKPPLKDW